MTMLDQEGGQNAEAGEGRGIAHDEGGGTGSTPGTGTAPCLVIRAITPQVTATFIEHN